MRVGVRLPQYGTDWPTLRETALRAERLGFDGLWLNDHLQAPGRLKTAPTFDAFTTLAALAALTSRARLGIVVMSASHRPPGLAVKMATVLDVIAGGRLTIGLGTGSDEQEHRAYGFPFGSPAERSDLALQTLAAFRAMAADPEGADLDGVLSGAPNLPASPQSGGPPVWLAAHRPQLLRAAGREADGVVAAFLSPEALGKRRAIAEEAREEAGRPEMAYCLYTYALPAGSEREAEGWLAAEAEALGSSPRRLLRWLRTTGIVGTPEEVRERLAAFADAGATDAVLVLPNRVPAEAFDALAEAGLPAAAGADAVAAGGAESHDGDDHASEDADAPALTISRASSPNDNLVHLLVESRREAGEGEALALVDDDGEWSVDDLSTAATRAAGALAERGVRRGDRVTIALPDGRSWLAAFLGAARLGAVPTPLDPAAPAELLAGILGDCEPAALVADTEAVPLAELTAAAGAAGAHAPIVAVTPADLADGDEAPVAAVHPGDLAYLVYSSGSTGAPKAAMHAHADLAVGIAGYGREVLGLGPEDRCHSVAKLFTSLGFGNGFFRVLGNGAAMVPSAGRPNVRSVLRLAERHQVTVLTAVPTFWAQLATFLERHEDQTLASSLRLLISSGDSLPGRVGERVRDRTGLDLLEGLGCSECSNVVISTGPGQPAPGTLGSATPGVEIRLADDAGAPVPDGTPGRLWIRSDSNTSGYWRRPDLTRELVHGEWVRMGDVLSAEEGVYRHMGRSDDLFKVDARWVSPVEVEGALHEHPAVAEAAVVGLPDEAGLLRPAAFVVLAEGTEADDSLAEELRAHVARRLERFKAPSRVTVLDELPRLASGKVSRRALREDPPAPAGG